MKQMHALMHLECVNGVSCTEHDRKPNPRHQHLPSSISGSEVNQRVAAILCAILNSAFSSSRIHGDY